MQVKALNILCACLTLGLANASPLQKRSGTCQKTKVVILSVVTPIQVVLMLMLSP